MHGADGRSIIWENIMIKSKWVALLAPVLVALAAVPGAPAAAQSFPNKPIRLVLPYAPGGATDFTGRTVAQYMSEVIGQQVVAENRTGSGGIPGTDFVVRSAPDGYTLVLMDPAIVINPSLLASVPFDVFKDLKVVSRVNSAALVLVASPHLPVKNFAELVAHAKANPGKLNFSSAGIGTTPHLGGELLKQRAGFDAVHVPYRGIGQSYTDMMGGKISFAFSSFAGALPFTADNRVRALATTGLKRSETHYSDLPTLDEAGLKGFEVELWYVILAPAATPPDVLAKLNDALVKTLAKPELKAAFAKIGAVPVSSSLDQSAAFLKVEHDKWKKVVTDGNIKEN
jgi:tripartite-type tricarboxylate transporter receptor subunit TctC